jgi:hypothetical protein
MASRSLFQCMGMSRPSAAGTSRMSNFLVQLRALSSALVLMKRNLTNSPNNPAYRPCISTHLKEYIPSVCALNHHQTKARQLLHAVLRESVHLCRLVNQHSLRCFLFMYMYTRSRWSDDGLHESSKATTDRVFQPHLELPTAWNTLSHYHVTWWRFA